MRRELAKAVRAEFSAQLGRLAPRFQPIKAQKIGGGCRPYFFEVATDLSFFVMLQVSTKAFDEFTVEVAFHSEPLFPIDLLACLPFNFAQTGVAGLASRQAVRIPLSHLWRRQEKNWDDWWEVTPTPTHAQLAQRLKDLVQLGRMDEMPLEEALGRVQPTVSDAIERLDHYGLPFLREIASYRRIEETSV